MKGQRYMKYLTSALLILIASKIVFGAEKGHEENAHAGKLRMESLVDEALAENPRLKDARRQVKASELSVKPAGTLPDPTIAFGLAAAPVDTFAFDREPMTQKVISLTQPFPFPGKLNLSREVAQRQSQAMSRKLEILEDMTAFEVRKEFLEWAYIERAVEITQTNIRIMESFTEIASSKYSVGKAAQWDVLKAQVERSKLEDKLATLEQKSKTHRAKLAALAGREKPLEGSPQIEWTRDFSLKESRLIATAEDNNPELAYYRSIAEKAESSSKLAKRQRLPDFSLTLSYGQREDGEMNGTTVDRPDFVGAMVGVKLPLYSFRKQKPLARAAEERSYGARMRFRNALLEIQSDVRDAVYRIERAGNNTKLYRTGILPQARTTVQSAISSYRVDEVDFLALLTSQLELMNHELDYYRLRIDRETDVAMLAKLLGTEPAELSKLTEKPKKEGTETGQGVLTP